MKQLVTSSKQLGLAVKRARKLKGLNQEEAGRPFKILQSTVSSIEHGAPGTQIETLFRMFAALDLELVVQTKEDVNSDEGW